mmetsp:Transcript_15057/g.35678  ORF Transcript_15057/g.35678 Transcript_15057/m.35678 type:complete len:278 (-) Transcript_15057:290-1123(-)
MPENRPAAGRSAGPAPGRMAGQLPEPLRQGQVAGALHRAQPGRAGPGWLQVGGPHLPGLLGRLPGNPRGDQPGSPRSLFACRRTALRLHPLPERPSGRHPRAGLNRRAPPAGLAHGLARPDRAGPATGARLGRGSTAVSEALASMRLDKWLWAARFYKTRALAVDEINLGRVRVSGQPVKPARDVRVGDVLSIRIGGVSREIEVRGLSNQRGPAPQAQLLYAETAASITAREAAAEARRLAPEPAATIVQGRPTKQDRRRLAEWDRWSVSIDDISPG